MSPLFPARQRLRRVFDESFAAADIAEPLASFDGTTPTAVAIETMARRKFGVASVCTDGTIGDPCAALPTPDFRLLSPDSHW